MSLGYQGCACEEDCEIQIQVHFEIRISRLCLTSRSLTVLSSPTLEARI